MGPQKARENFGESTMMPEGQALQEGSRVAQLGCDEARDEPEPAQQQPHQIEAWLFCHAYATGLIQLVSAQQ